MASKRRVRCNDEIEATEVRVVGAEGDQVGVMEREKAIEMAFGNDMDLVEVSPNADPPVCRIMDFGKYLFEQNKKAHAGRKKQKQIHVKEVKFRPGTEENDYQVKLQNLVRFLQQGDKAKVTLRFRGREMAHQELGVKLLKRVENDLEELATVEQFPKMEGRQLVMLMTPKKK